MNDHNFCAFYKNSRLIFGWIKQQNDNKIIIVPEIGNEFKCSFKQLEYTWQSQEYNSSQNLIEFINIFDSSRTL